MKGLQIDFLISFSTSDRQGLLSISNDRSLYELGFAGKFKILDFLLSVAYSLNIKNIILFEKENPFVLQDFIETSYLQYKELQKSFRIEVFPETYESLHNLRDMLKGKNYNCLIYTGDIPFAANVFSFLDVFFSQKNPMVFRLSFRKEGLLKLILSNSKAFVRVLDRVLKSSVKSPNLFESIANNFMNEGAIEYIDYAYFRDIKSIFLYYTASMEVVRRYPFFYNLFGKYGIFEFFSQKSESRILKGAKVYNSIISEGTKIAGEVENSIIFGNVEVGKNTVIKNSIIMEGNRIAPNCKIYNTVVDRFDLGNYDGYNIKEGTVIGREESKESNREYPKFIKRGITFIGRNVVLPKKVRVGAGCYVLPNTGEEQIKPKTAIRDGFVF